jgi:hypothetical protein
MQAGSISVLLGMLQLSDQISEQISEPAPELDVRPAPSPPPLSEGGKSEGVPDAPGLSDGVHAVVLALLSVLDTTLRGTLIALIAVIDPTLVTLGVPATAHDARSDCAGLQTMLTDCA